MGNGVRRNAQPERGMLGVCVGTVLGSNEQGMLVGRLESFICSSGGVGVRRRELERGEAGEVRRRGLERDEAGGVRGRELERGKAVHYFG